MKAKVINLKAYIEAYNNKEIFESYKYINDIRNMNKHEYDDIYVFASELYKSLDQTPGVETKKLFGYHLDKEIQFGLRHQFDLLRFSKDSILNIELKNKKVSLENIKKQLINHKFLLSCIEENRQIHTFTFISKINKLYTLSGDQLKEVSFKELCDVISKDYLEDNLLETLEPESLIVSPYSDIKKFVQHNYFLSNEQEKTVNDILKSGGKNSMIKGGAGTGKSLVLFDLANKLVDRGYKTLFIFCSILENNSTINREVKFDFIDIKGLESVDLEKYNYILIDESQRLLEDNFNRLIQSKSKIVFAIDKKQSLKKEERALNLENKLEKISGIKKFNLKNKIRTDVSLSTFILKFFDKSVSGLQPMEFPKVNAVYFEDIKNARYFINMMRKDENYESIEVASYTTRSGITYNKKIHDSKDGFKVIGREYDNVLIPIDERVYYENNSLIYDTSKDFYYPYIGLNGLFQAVTRVKKNLLFVVIKNKKLYREIQEIINWKELRETRRITDRLKLLRECNNYKNLDVAKSIGCNENTYEKIEESGKFPSKKLLNNIAEFYNVSSNYLIGEPIELSLTEFDILYQNIIKNKTDVEKAKINNSLIDYLKKL